MTTLAELRRDLAQAKDTLRAAKTDLETAKTIATMHAIGKNDDERKKAKDQALLNDLNYKKAQTHLQTCEYEVERLEAEIDIARDERTARDLNIREENNRVLDRLATAYLALAARQPEQGMINDQTARVERGGLPF